MMRRLASRGARAAVGLLATLRFREASHEGFSRLRAVDGATLRHFSRLYGGRDPGSFRIGDVELPIVDGSHPEKIPAISPWAAQYFPPNATTLSYLRWMMQKDLLKQDMCIIGEPGPARRWLALQFCHYAMREVQVLTITRDATEADIKQRREIRNGALCYLDQAAVSAALNGHVLIIDGLERAERNVLPILNNLLENREMHLDNGQMLIHPARYDQLLAEHKTPDLKHLGLLRVSENFRVIALTVPVPKYPGNPLDPPLRSRFQCMFLHKAALQNSLWNAIKDAPSADQLMKFKAVLTASDEGGHDRDKARKFPDVSDLEALVMAHERRIFPNEALGHIVTRVYPAELLCLDGTSSRDARAKIKEIKALLQRYDALAPPELRSPLLGITRRSEWSAEMTFGGAKAPVAVPCGNGAMVDFSRLPAAMSFASPHVTLLHGMMQSHAAGRNLCLVGPSGCGKTALIREFCQALGYHCLTLHLYADMSSRDLLQRRTTDPKTGDTQWEPSSLVRGIRDGCVVVLDGIDSLPQGSLSVLQELLVDGSITLLDGTKYLRSEHFDELRETLGGLSEAKMAELGIHRVHPSFRVIAASRLPTTANGKKFWLTADVAGLFDFHVFPEFDEASLKALLEAELAKSLTDGATPTTKDRKMVSMVVGISKALDALHQTDNKMPTLSLRQMLRVVRYLAKFPAEGYDALSSALLLSLMSPVAAEGVNRILGSFGLAPSKVSESASTARKAGSLLSSFMSGAGGAKAGGVPGAQEQGDFSLTISREKGSDDDVKERIISVAGEEVLRLTRVYNDEELALVPAVFNFYPNALHAKLLAWLAKVFGSGDRILLIGNQGVGKNKIVDYFLSRAQLPRHYVQLHRDTTVSSLTINPSVIDGRVVWEDSPLVKAVTLGHTLVVDEIDKAPVEVVQILKGLIEDGEMTLGDGRRISRWERGADVITLHPDFRMIVLANPPGFPFHGNSFYRECGDLFSCLVVQNPDAKSQEDVLVRYAPSVPRPLIAQLVRVFADLGKLFEEGAITYPFSLRELINVVKHLQAFPQDGLYQALNNVFNFDALDPNTLDHVRRLLQEHVKKNAVFVRNQLAPEVELEKIDSMLTIAPQHVGGEAPPAQSSPGLDLPVELTQFARQKFVTLEHVLETFPPALSSGGANAGVFTEVSSSQQVSFLGANDRALGLVVLPRRLVTFLVHTSYATEDSHFRLVTVADPSADIGAGVSPLAAGRVVSVILPSSLKDAKSLHLSGALFGSTELVLIDAATGDIYSIDPLTGSAAISNFFSSEDTAARQISASTPALVGRPSAVGSVTQPQAVAISAPESNHLSIFYFGVVLRITIPDIVESFSFFSPQLIQLKLRREGECLMKLVVMSGTARAMLYRLAAASAPLGGQFVGQAVPAISGAAPGGSAGPATNDDLAHSVFIPSTSSDIAFGSVRRSSPAETPATAGGAASLTTLTVDGYRLPSAAIAPAVTAYDPNTRQLIALDAAAGKVTVVDAAKKTARTFSIPVTSDSNAARASQPMIHVGPSGHAIVFDGDRTITAFDADAARLRDTYARWAKVMESGGAAGLTGGPPTPANLEMSYSKPRRKPSGDLKHGKEDEDNEPHVGGNTWAGGTGGTDTAGLGGLVGPYRLDKGHKVHQVSPEEKAKVPKEIIEEAKAMGKRALEKRLGEISMTQEENAMYMSTLDDVQGQIAQLQLMLAQLKAKEGERVWVKHQTDGVWDDAKIVEGITGEKAIYKRRSDKNNESFFHHKKKKRLLFVLDVSASMYRFNSYDQRLNRLIETAVMIMESFVGFEDKIDYAIVGHNGDSAQLPLVNFGNPPANKKERMKVCLQMIAYSQYCWRGDHTVDAMRMSIKTVTEQDADSYYVFVISDANLDQYGISPRTLSQIILSDERVSMYAIFIASFGGQATQLQQQLPAGHGFETLDTKQLPLVLKRIFTATNLLG